MTAYTYKKLAASPASSIESTQSLLVIAASKHPKIGALQKSLTIKKCNYYNSIRSYDLR